MDPKIRERIKRAGESWAFLRVNIAVVVQQRRGRRSSRAARFACLQTRDTRPLRVGPIGKGALEPNLVRTLHFEFQSMQLRSFGYLPVKGRFSTSTARAGILTRWNR